jgi:hypothetical protein
MDQQTIHGGELTQVEGERVDRGAVMLGTMNAFPVPKQ